MKNPEYTIIGIGTTLMILLLFLLRSVFPHLFSIFLFSTIEIIAFTGLLSFFIWLKKKQKIQNFRQPTLVLCITAFSISLLYIIPFIANNQCANGFSLYDLSKINEKESQNLTITFMNLPDDLTSVPKVKIAIEQLDSDPISTIRFYELDDSEWKIYSDWFLDQQQKYNSTVKVSDFPEYLITHYFIKDEKKYIMVFKNC